MNELTNAINRSKLSVNKMIDDNKYFNDNMLVIIENINNYLTHNTNIPSLVEITVDKQGFTYEGNIEMILSLNTKLDYFGVNGMENTIKIIKSVKLFDIDKTSCGYRIRFCNE